ncbi:MAG TPA: hypothetical protein VF753_12895, partial [Terriglobales bacterium]
CSGGRCPGFALSHLTQLLHDRFRSGSADYFDFATGLEASVIFGWWNIAERFLDLTLSIPGEAWELETTANNLTLLAEVAPGCSRRVVLSLAETLRAQVPQVGLRSPLRDERLLMRALRCVVEMSKKASFEHQLTYHGYVEVKYKYNCWGRREIREAVSILPDARS